MRNTWVRILSMVIVITLTGLFVGEKPAAAKAETAGADVVPGKNRLTTEQMALAEKWPGMDESAIRSVMDKAAAGKKVTIALLGGSITKGKISKGSLDSKLNKHLSYAEYFQNWWEKAFPKAQFHFVNAGMGSTDSYLGLHRAQTDVLSEKPDLVVVEFAVNDMRTEEFQCVYENLIRQLLEADKQSALILLFTATISGFSCQKQQAEVGRHYGIPMLSYRNVMKDLLKSEAYTQKQLSGDKIHPSALGHAIIGEIFQRYLNRIWQKPKSEIIKTTPTEEYLTEKKYQNPRILDNKSLKVKSLGTFAKSKVMKRYPNNWTCKNGSGNMCFTVTCKNLGFLYLAQTDGKGGQFNVYVDGKWVAKLNADYSEGTHIYSKAQACYSSDTKKKHTVRISKSGVSTGKEMTIIAVLVSN